MLGIGSLTGTPAGSPLFQPPETSIQCPQEYRIPTAAVPQKQRNGGTLPQQDSQPRVPQQSGSQPHLPSTSRQPSASLPPLYLSHPLYSGHLQDTYGLGLVLQQLAVFTNDGIPFQRPFGSHLAWCSADFYYSSSGKDRAFKRGQFWQKMMEVGAGSWMEGQLGR